MRYKIILSKTKYLVPCDFTFYSDICSYDNNFLFVSVDPNLWIPGVFISIIEVLFSSDIIS